LLSVSLIAPFIVAAKLLTDLTQICETFEVWLIMLLKEKKNS